MVYEEYYLYHIIITRSCGGSHSSVCYYLSQPAKQAVFIVVPITFPNIVRFTSENANLILLTFCLQPNSLGQI